MRFEDYLNKLEDYDREYVLENLEQEEEELREFLKQFNEEQLNCIATTMNDVFGLRADELNVTDFLVELYKCQKADFLYDNVEFFIDDINMLAEELEDLD